MHPTLARYLNIDAAAETLQRDEQGQPLAPEERQYAAVAKRDPERRAAILAARGMPQPSDEAQQALLYLAAHGAVGALREDESLRSLVEAAENSLRVEGAEDEEISQFLASLVLEEAFGYDEGAERFDRDFFEETLKLVPELATLTRERVDAVIESFTRTAEEGWRRAYNVAAQVLVETAWEDGPEPINPEHVENAVELAARRLGKADEAKAGEATRRFIEWLEKQRLVGPQRRMYLVDAVGRVSGQGATPNTPLN